MFIDGDLVVAILIVLVLTTVHSMQTRKLLVKTTSGKSLMESMVLKTGCQLFGRRVWSVIT